MVGSQVLAILGLHLESFELQSMYRLIAAWILVDNDNTDAIPKDNMQVQAASMQKQSPEKVNHKRPQSYAQCGWYLNANSARMRGTDPLNGTQSRNHARRFSSFFSRRFSLNIFSSFLLSFLALRSARRLRPSWLLAAESTSKKAFICRPALFSSL